LHDADRFRWDVERFSDHLGQRGIRTLAHVDRTAIGRLATGSAMISGPS
jgi:hypothetical protein